MDRVKASNYRNGFIKEKYDRINLTFKKGRKEEIEEFCKTKGYKSITSYINDLIDKDMESFKEQ